MRSLLIKPLDQSQIPELIIRSITREEVEALRREQRTANQELGCEDDDLINEAGQIVTNE